mgnify:CR=1 FL=1
MSKDKRIPAIDVTPRDSDAVEISLYSAREKIHPKSINGRFERVREITIWSTMGLYLILPWVQWDGRQAVWFDLPGRQFHIFGISFWPQDFVLLSWLLILGAFALFFFTVLAGRVYCGYVCPQTTWTKFFTWVEDWIEGDRSARIKLDAAPWSMNKVVKRLSKHSVWLFIALITGITFVGYFTPITDLVYRFAGLSLDQAFAPLVLGIAFGLFIGKQIGIFGVVWLAVKTGFASKPRGATWLQIYAVAILCGIGFTMSLFIGGLSFSDGPQMDAVRLGVLLASTVAAVAGFTLLRATRA